MATYCANDVDLQSCCHTFEVLKGHVCIVPQLLMCLPVTMLAMMLVILVLALNSICIMMLALATVLLVTMLVMVTSKRPPGSGHVRAALFREGLIRVGHVRPWLPVSVLVSMLVPMLVAFGANLDPHKSARKAIATSFSDSVLSCQQSQSMSTGTDSVLMTCDTEHMHNSHQSCKSY